MTRIGRDSAPRLAPLLALVAIACFVAAGCGGDGGDGGGGGDASAAADAPEPRTHQAFATQVAELLAGAEDEGDCARLEEIDRRSSADLSCPAPEALRTRMGEFEPVDALLLYTDRAGIVRYRPGESGAVTSMVLLKDYRNLWTVQQLDIGPEQAPANAPGEGAPSMDRAIDGYERAVRERDCEGIARFAYRPAGAPRPSCEARLAATARLVKVMKGDPGQRPALNGATRDFGFYSMTAYHPTATHHTFTVVRTTGGGDDRYFVADVVRDEG